MADDDRYLYQRASKEFRAVISDLEREEESRAQVEKYRDRIMGRLKHRREDLQFGDSWDKRAVPDRERYDVVRRAALTPQNQTTSMGSRADRR